MTDYNESNEVMFESKTSGVSVTGVQQYIKDIKTFIINEACESLENGKEELNEILRARWASDAEENFEQNLDKQVKIVIESLKAAEIALESELNAIVNT